MLDGLGKTLIYLGIVLVVVGVVIHVGGRFFDLGHLPGDFKWSSGNTTFYFPAASCIIISIVLSIILNLF